VRYQRREISQNWSKLSEEVYHPARSARIVEGLYQNWNSYGGDEFLTPDGWIDPERTMQSPFIIYHLYSVFPANMLNKRKNDAEWLAPGDKGRVRILNTVKGRQFKMDGWAPPKNIYSDLPALAKGLPYMPLYKVRECLFNLEWLHRSTGLCYQ